jgi:hypothetical protein
MSIVKQACLESDITGHCPPSERICVVKVAGRSNVLLFVDDTRRFDEQYCQAGMSNNVQVARFRTNIWHRQGYRRSITRSGVISTFFHASTFLDLGICLFSAATRGRRKCWDDISYVSSKLAELRWSPIPGNTHTIHDQCCRTLSPRWSLVQTCAMVLACGDFAWTGQHNQINQTQS